MRTLTHRLDVLPDIAAAVAARAATFKIKDTRHTAITTAPATALTGLRSS